MLGITNLYDQRNLELTHQLNAALKAWSLFHQDQQYIVKDGEVIIVDEFTGRLMYGRRYSDGIHQAIEAKEGLNGSQRGSDARDDHVPELFPPLRQTCRHDGYCQDRGARVPRDLRARRRRHADESRRCVRNDHADIVYKSENAKFEAVVDEIIAEHEQGPAGARRYALDREERAAGRCCAGAGVECNVLNAKYHEQEAADHQGCRAARRGDDRDQHGRPRRRHQARRGRRRDRRPAHHRHRAARVAADRQSAARPRRPPRRPGLARGSTSRSKTN